MGMFYVIMQPCFVLQQSTIMIQVVSRSCVCRWGTQCTYLRNWKVSESKHMTSPDISLSFFLLKQTCAGTQMRRYINCHFSMHNNVNESTPLSSWHPVLSTVCLFIIFLCSFVCSGWYRGYSLRKKSHKVWASLGLHYPLKRCQDVYIPICVWLFPQGIFPASYIHLKEATVEGIGWDHTSVNIILMKIHFAFGLLSRLVICQYHSSTLVIIIIEDSVMFFLAVWGETIQLFIIYRNVLQSFRMIWHDLWVMSHFSNILFFSFVAGSQQEIIIPADLPLVQELGATLREWVQIWHKLYVVCVKFLPVNLPLCF